MRRRSRNSSASVEGARRGRHGRSLPTIDRLPISRDSPADWSSACTSSTRFGRARSEIGRCRRSSAIRVVEVGHQRDHSNENPAGCGSVPEEPGRSRSWRRPSDGWRPSDARDVRSQAARTHASGPDRRPASFPDRWAGQRHVRGWRPEALQELGAARANECRSRGWTCRSLPVTVRPSPDVEHTRQVVAGLEPRS